LHKIFYIGGNIVEHVRRKNGNFNETKGDVDVPRLLILDITHSCNMNCLMCDIWKTKPQEEDIDLAYIKKVLQEAVEVGTKDIALSGGEALTREDIFEIFDFARSLQIKNLGVLTNGLLVERYLERLRPYLIDGTISLVISLDSLQPSIHNYIRNSSEAWQRATGSLEKLSLLKEEYSQINFNVISIILNQNLEELFDLVAFVKSSGANSLQFQPLLPNNLRMAERKGSPFWVSPERLSLLDEVIDGLIEFKKGQYPFIKNSVRNLTLIKKYYRGEVSADDVDCLSAGDTVLISNQGHCSTCFSSYGDIKKEGLRVILASNQRRRAQERVRQCSSPCLLPCFCDGES